MAYVGAPKNGCRDRSGIAIDPVGSGSHRSSGKAVLIAVFNDRPEWSIADTPADEELLSPRFEWNAMMNPCPVPFFASNRPLGTMRARVGAIVCFLFSILPAFVLPGWAQETGDAPKESRVNPKKSVPVVEYSLTGGMPRAPGDDFRPEPLLRIWDDGRIVVGRTNPQQKRCEMQWPAECVQQLIQFIVDEHRFFDADSKAIADAIKATGRPVLLMDSLTARIVVRADRQEHAVEVYALGYVASEYPEVPMLQHLGQIEKRLKYIVGVCRLGGEDVLKTALDDVNRKLKSEIPDAAPFSVEDFVSASEGRNSTVIAAFQREEVDADGKVTRRITGTWTKTDAGAVNVSVFAFSAPEKR